jgi:hypothetical protein
VYHLSASWRVQMETMSPENGILFMFVISMAIGVCLSLMLAWHVYLVLSAQVRCSGGRLQCGSWRKCRHRGHAVLAGRCVIADDDRVLPQSVARQAREVERSRPPERV